MHTAPNTPKHDRFRLQPNWIPLSFCTAAFLFGVYNFYYQDSAKFFPHLILSFVYLSLVPRFVWGFDLDKHRFTIRVLFFPVRQIPWDQVAQVLLIQRTFKYKDSTFPYEYLCITLKPAEPLPFFYENELGRHKRRNIFLVWNLCRFKPERTRWRCMKAFEQYWGKVEVRRYKYQEPE